MIENQSDYFSWLDERMYKYPSDVLMHGGTTMTAMAVWKHPNQKPSPHIIVTGTREQFKVYGKKTGRPPESERRLSLPGRPDLDQRCEVYDTLETKGAVSLGQGYVATKGGKIWAPKMNDLNKQGEEVVEKLEVVYDEEPVISTFIGEESIQQVKENVSGD